MQAVYFTAGYLQSYLWYGRVVLVIVIFRLDAMMFFFFFQNKFYLTDPSEILTQ